MFQLIQRAKSAFKEVELIAWAAQLLLALSYLHSRKILHRDLKVRTQGSAFASSAPPSAVDYRGPSATINGCSSFREFLFYYIAARGHPL